MKSNTIVIDGVVVEYNGEYWGKSQWGEMMYGTIERANISTYKNTRTTDFTYSDSPFIKELKKGKLVKVKKTITTVIETYKEDKQP